MIIKIFKSKWLSVVAVLLVGWMGLAFTKINLHKNIVNKEVGDLEVKIEGLEKNNSALAKFIEYMANPSFLEKEARLKLNYKALEEEVAFVYTADDSMSGLASDSFETQLAQMPNFIKWWYYILGY